MIDITTYRRIVRISAAYDLGIGLAFSNPLTLGPVWSLLGAVQQALGLGTLPSLDVHAGLFANFFGTVVTLWALVRLLRPDDAFGRIDATGRAAFVLWMGAALMAGATPLLAGFMVIEVAFGIAQALPITRSARTA